MNIATLVEIVEVELTPEEAPELLREEVAADTVEEAVPPTA
jgi:hypothetical protein